MGLENVLAEIRAGSAREQERIRAEARKEAEGILEQARYEAKTRQEQREREARSRAEAMGREMIGASEFEARRGLLSVQRALMDDFRQRVLAALAGLPEERNHALLDALAKTARKEIPRGTVSAREKDLGALAKHGYERGQTISGAGGFVVVSADGTLQLDNRFEGLLESTWKEMLLDHAKLFEVG